jgi:hemin uptake protein HemP
LRGIGKMNSRPDQDTANPSAGEGRPGAMEQRTIKIIEGRIDSRDLFVGTREIIIGHGDNRYRLRLTAQNKLILTK